MKKRNYILIVIILLISIPFYAEVKKDDSIESIIKESDELYKGREKLLSLKQSIWKLEEALKINKNNFGVLWRLARAHYSYGNKVDEEYEDRRLMLFDKGKNYAMDAIEVSPKRAEGHFWYGVNLGMWGETNGVMKSLSLRGDIEQTMLKASKLNEKYEGAGAYRVLGRLKFRLPGIFGGDNDESIMYLKKAIKLAPTHTMNYLFLAETYMEEDMYIEAKKLLDTLLAMEPDERWIPETAADKEAAKELLIEVKEELED